MSDQFGGHGQFQGQDESLVGNQAGGAGGGGRMAMPPAGTPLTLFHFSSGICVAFGGFYGALYCIFGEFQPINVIQQMYLGIFGLLLMILDTPVANIKFVKEYREHMSKYIHLLTRVVGKGLTFVFLGLMTWVSLMTNDISVFLPIVVGLYIIVVGVITTFLGLRMSRKLDSMRQALIASGAGDIGGYRAKYDQFATNPAAGLNKSDFNTMFEQTVGGTFSDSDSRAIFNALSSGLEKTYITCEDLEYWKNGPFVCV